MFGGISGKSRKQIDIKDDNYLTQIKNKMTDLFLLICKEMQGLKAKASEGQQACKKHIALKNMWNIEYEQIYIQSKIKGSS